jgi:broad specificity phosphatase PhoE
MAGSATILRHAPSTWNLRGRWQGQADPPLSSDGEAMALAARPALGPVDLVVTSALTRAARTGALLAPGAPRLVEPDLGEYDLGEWTGLDREAIAARWPDELDQFDRGRLEAPPGGETRSGFDARVARAAARLAAAVADLSAEPDAGRDGGRRSSRRGGQNGGQVGGQGRAAVRVLVVTHAGVIRALCRLQGLGEVRVDHLCGFDAHFGVGGLSLGEHRCLPTGDTGGSIGPPAGGRQAGLAADPAAL